MGRGLAVVALALTCLFAGGCERPGSLADEEPPGPRTRQRHAAYHGEFSAHQVVFTAQELNLLNPRSERARRAGEARLMLDELVEVMDAAADAGEGDGPPPTPPHGRSSHRR